VSHAQQLGKPIPQFGRARVQARRSFAEQKVDDGGFV